MMLVVEETMPKTWWEKRCNILPGGVLVFVEFYFRVYSR
jgi:hypothetical protein